MSIVREAIENAAAAGNGVQTDIERPPGYSWPSGLRIGVAREIIRRFLEDVPPEMMAFELLEQIEAER